MNWCWLRGHAWSPVRRERMREFVLGIDMGSVDYWVRHCERCKAKAIVGQVEKVWDEES